MLEIIRMGCNYRHGSDFKIVRPNGYDCYLALFIKTRSELMDEGERIAAEPGTFVLFDKNAPHYYAAASEAYIDDWIQFDSDEAFLHEYTLPFNKPFFVGNSIRLEDYFKIICDAFFRCSSSHTIDCLLRGMLSELSDIFHNPCGSASYAAALIELRRDVYSYPARHWTVDGMAERLHLSSPYFQEIYKSTFGASCIADVIAARISQAKNLLSNSELSINEIAYRCGYNNGVHFSRQFRREAGTSPSDWRRASSVR